MSLYLQWKVGDILESGPPRQGVYAITQKRISIFFKLGTHVKGGQRKISILR